MEKLNLYKKIQIILLVLIIILGLVLIISSIQKKSLKKSQVSETFSESTDIAKDNPSNMPENSTADVQEENIEDTSWDDEDAEDTEVTEEEKKSENNKTQYYIKVNYTANCVTVYKKDDSGNYTIPVKALICSTGKATPRSGVYKTSQKYRWHQLNGGVYGQYCTRITGHILFHSVPCAKNTPDSLKYVAYDKLGTTASAGCVRLTVEGAMWIFNNCSSGTLVEFYSSSNPGPLGKPSAQKISSNVQCRNWDPTDPDPRNPWHGYVEPEPIITTTQDIQTPQQNNDNTNQNKEVQAEEKTEEQNTTSQNTITDESGQSGKNEISDDKKDNTVVEHPSENTTGDSKENQTIDNTSEDSYDSTNQTSTETKD